MGDRAELVAPAGKARLDAVLAAGLPQSRARLSSLVKAGHVTVDGVVVRQPRHTLRGGERLVVLVPPPPPAELEPEDLALPVLYIDDDVVVVDKPAGLVVHPGKGHPRGTLVNGLLHLLRAPVAGQRIRGHAVDPSRPGIVHRLDRGTSGVMVVARHPDAHARLAQQFHDRTVGRRYVCVVLGAPKETAGTVDAPLARHPTDRLRFAVREGGRHAITHWRRIGEGRYGVAGDARGGRVSLMVCRLQTGRTHQIRVHMKHVGLPIVGDPLYGARRVPGPIMRALAGHGDQLLHASHLAFDPPGGGPRLTFTTPPPAAFREAADVLGLGESLAEALADRG
ncbi:MAG: RluA family pseudouridine synthase, partial [Myxococcota bacterium]|nr:RluA family pseudouridine synthase [Myxococcota bacterium]